MPSGRSTLSITLRLLLFLLLCSSLPVVLSWGADAHTAIAFLAQSLFTANSTALALQLLPVVDHGLIHLIASWADGVRITPYHWSASYHFADIPAWNCSYLPSRDCVKPLCVDAALANYTQRLLNLSLDAQQRMEALMFVVHYAADAHQPLHVGFKSDLGGNEIAVRFLGVANNLHAVWDTAAVQHRVKLDYANNYTAWMVGLQQTMNGPYAKNQTQWTSCAPAPHAKAVGGSPAHGLAAYVPCSGVWVRESAELACGAYLDDDLVVMNKSSAVMYNLTVVYYTRHMPLIEQRIIQAGVRLAFLLNTVTTALAHTTNTTAAHSTTTSPPASPHPTHSSTHEHTTPTQASGHASAHVPAHHSHVQFGVHTDDASSIERDVSQEDTQHDDEAHADHGSDRLPPRMSGERL